MRGRLSPPPPLRGDVKSAGALLLSSAAATIVTSMASMDAIMWKAVTVGDRTHDILVRHFYGLFRADVRCRI